MTLRFGLLFATAITLVLVPSSYLILKRNNLPALFFIYHDGQAAVAAPDHLRDSPAGRQVFRNKIGMR